MDILKDAAAASIYGSRGSNGVVLITTKRGAAGEPTSPSTRYVGTQSAARRLELLNATEYLEFFNESAFNDGYGENYYGELGVADSANADWQDAVLRSAPISSSELAVSGGDERLAYRLSGTWFDQEGIVRSPRAIAGSAADSTWISIPREGSRCARARVLVRPEQPGRG